MQMAGKAIQVFSEEPYVSVLLQSKRGLRCDSCFELCESLKKCTACGLLRYCNTKCQRSDWISHKKECKCLKQVAPNIPLDSVRLMLRIIIRVQEGSKDTVNDVNSEIPKPWKRKFEDLQSHVKEIQEDEQRKEQFTQIVYTLQRLTENVLDLPAPDHLFEIFGKMVINSFTICDGEMQSIGVGIYLSGSLLDHSCQPNAVTTFSGKTIHLRTLGHVFELTPSVLRISYIDQMALTLDRKKQLQQQYYFECDCPRCSDKHLDGMMSCIKCQKDTCQDGCLSQFADGSYSPCIVCGWHDVDSDLYENAAKYQKNITDSLSEVKSFKDDQNDKREILQLCEKCLERNKQFAHPYNVNIVQILDQAFDVCIDLGDWDKALSYGSRTLPSYRKFYPTNSPNIGIQLMKVGKIHLYLGTLREALKLLREAEGILSVTHRKDHELYQQLTELINQCYEEMRVNLEFSSNAIE